MYGFTQFQTVQDANFAVRSYVYDDTGNQTDIRYCPYGWWTNYEIDGEKFIGIRVYGMASEWSNSKVGGYMQATLQSSITLDNLYKFQMAFGYMGNASVASSGNGYSNFWLRYYQDGVAKSLNTSFFSAANAINVDTGSSTAVQVSQWLYPNVATAPIYDFYTVSGDPGNYTAGVYGFTYLNRPETVGDVDYSAYTYLLFSCPTITTDKDTLVQIEEKLDSITSTMEGVQTELEETNSLLDDIKEGIGGVVDKITSLPGEIWNTVSTGLTELFLPSEEALTDYKSDLEALLSDHFGAVWQTGDLIAEYFENFDAADPKETILFPEVTIDVGAPFTFGGWEVQVVPDGFDFLIESLKWIIDVICTLAVVNTLKERLSDILVGGEQDVT